MFLGNLINQSRSCYSQGSHFSVFKWLNNEGMRALYLVGSADEVQVVAVEELADHISSKRERDPTIVFSPALDVLVWVRPQQITQEAWWEKYTILTTNSMLSGEALTGK